MMQRTSWTERQGDAFFPPPLLLRQEPCRYQRKRLMMVPTLPGADVVLRQARLAFGPPQAFLHPMLRIHHPRELPQRRVERRVREGVVVFHDLAALSLAEDHQHFLGPVARPAFRLHP